MFYIPLIVICLILPFIGFALVFKLINRKGGSKKKRFTRNCVITIIAYLAYLTFWGINIIDRKYIEVGVLTSIHEYLTGEWYPLHITALIITVMSLVFNYRWLEDE